MPEIPPERSVERNEKHKGLLNFMYKILLWLSSLKRMMLSLLLMILRGCEDDISFHGSKSQMERIHLI